MLNTHPQKQPSPHQNGDPVSPLKTKVPGKHKEVTFCCVFCLSHVSEIISHQRLLMQTFNHAEYKISVEGCKINLMHINKSCGFSGRGIISRTNIIHIIITTPSKD